MNPTKYLASTAAAAYLALAGTPALADTMLPDGLACIEYSADRNKDGANIITIPVFEGNYDKLEEMLDDNTLYTNPIILRKVSREEVERAYIKRPGKLDSDHQLDHDEVCAEITLPEDLSGKLDVQRGLSRRYLAQRDDVQKELETITKLYEDLRDTYLAKEAAQQDDKSFTSFDLTYGLLSNNKITLHDFSLGYTNQNEDGLFYNLNAGVRIPSQDPQAGKKKLTAHTVTKSPDGDITERTDFSTPSSEADNPSFTMGAKIGGNFDLGAGFSLVGAVGIRGVLGERETFSTIDRVITLNGEQQENLTAKGKDGKQTVWSFEVPLELGLVYSLDKNNNIFLLGNIVPTANNPDNGHVLGGAILGLQHKY